MEKVFNTQFEQSYSCLSSFKIWKPFLKRAILGLVFLLISSIIMIFANTYAAYKLPYGTQLPDVALDIFPEPELCSSDIASPVSISLGVGGLVFAIAIIFLPKGGIVSIRFLILLSVVYFFRSTTVSTTQLINTLDKCDNLNFNSYGDALEWAAEGLFFDTCGDYMFSGHTSLLTSLWITWLSQFLVDYNSKPKFEFGEMDEGTSLISRKKKRNNVWFYLTLLTIVLLFCSLLVGMLFLLMCRFHYTIDIIVGLIITVLTNCTYWWLIPKFKLFQWFENLYTENDE
eukprot:TRINITY_DN86_c2_g1_i1.p1 TRINITY_DN86_c2_g1~~TRINITY_DN86_c2_g1_i1.p1  ORF type:complete len:286 (+),score=72.70 TRINITY_DN86_c2_g1_i1:78-935(+)